MTFSNSTEALQALKIRIDGDPAEPGSLIPAGRTGFGICGIANPKPIKDPNPLWTADPATPDRTPLGDPRSYRLHSTGCSPGLSAADLHESPYAVLEDDDELSARDLSVREQYRKVSADVTMRGGTTSGVVYPLAICEIARAFRLRNIGGASAGALAAAAAAAAELGRSEADLSRSEAENEAENEAKDTAGPDREVRRTGHVRPGFAGLSDVMYWLAELDTFDEKREPGQEFRLGQLFVPTPGSRMLFRVLTALQRRYYLRLPLLVLGALGNVAQVLNLVVLPALAAFALAALAKPSFVPAGPLAPWAQVAVCAGVLLLTTLALFGAGLLGGTLSAVAGRRRAWRKLPKHRQPEKGPASWPADAREWRNLAAGLVLLVGGGAGTAGALVVTDGLGSPWFLIPTVLAGVLLGQLVVLAISVWGLLYRAGEKARFGLVSGAGENLTSGAAARRGRWLDRFSGRPAQTVDRAVVSWLSDTLNELAGLPQGEVLRFGHLWTGAGYRATGAPVDPHGPACDARRRRINLELITTELVHGVPYRFPLDPRLPASTRLYFDPNDLCSPGREVVPAAVVEAMKQNAAPVRGLDVHIAAKPRELWRLPIDGALPVIFAARLSLALPAVFEAVPLYLRVDKTTVRNEFGEALLDENGVKDTLKYPKDDPEDADIWVEQLWFSDGGITSNFPVHFFDAPLPLWPTFGINLGSHPPGFGDQDVWLPQDWGGRRGDARMFDGFAGFLGAIVSTARGWRDTANMLMPAYRGRVATVRQRPDEGGTNFFMESGTIASLALRGAFAGARLRRRFDPASPHRYWWNRHQWMRLRIAAHNFEELRRGARMADADPLFQTMTTNPAEAQRQLDRFVTASKACANGTGIPGDPDRPHKWFGPAPGSAAFWTGFAPLRQLRGVTTLTTVVEPDLLPTPDLRQVPPL
jgi:Patatin-like phospholipase